MKPSRVFAKSIIDHKLSRLIGIIISFALLSACGEESSKSASNGIDDRIAELAAENPQTLDAIAERCELLQNRGPNENAAEQASNAPGQSANQGNRPPEAGRPADRELPPGQARRLPPSDDLGEDDELDEADELDLEFNPEIHCPGLEQAKEDGEPSSDDTDLE